MPYRDVLIVDMNPDLLRVLREALQKEGFTVHTASDGETGLDTLHKARPDILFIGFGLEGKEFEPLKKAVEKSLSSDGPRVVPIYDIYEDSPGGLSQASDAEQIGLGENTFNKTQRILYNPPLESSLPNNEQQRIAPVEPPDARTVPWHVFEALDEGVIQTNGQGIILTLNAVAARQLGLPKTDLLGNPLFKYFEPASIQPIEAILKSRWKTTHVPLRVITHQGHQLDLRILPLDSSDDPRETGRFLISRFVGGEFEADGDSIRKDNELELLHEILSRARSLAPIDATLPFLLERAVKLLDAEAGSVALLEVEDPDHGHLALRYTVGEKAEKVRSIYIPTGHGLIGWCVSNNEAAIVNEVEKDPRFFPWVDQISGYKTRSLLCLPIRSEGEVIGALEIVNKRKGPFSPKDLLVLTACVNAATINMRTALVQQRLISRRDYYSGIMDSLTEGVLILGNDYSVLDVNQAFMMFLNRERADIIGSKCHKVIWNRESPCEDCLVERFRIFQTGKDFSTTQDLRNLRGQSYRFLISGTPLEIRDEIISSVVLTFNDITRAHRLQEYLQASASVASLLHGGQPARETIGEALGIMGKAAGASRSYWFEESQGEKENQPSLTLQAQWHEDGFGPLFQEGEGQRPLYPREFFFCNDLLRQGRAFSGLTREFPKAAQEPLKERDVEAVLLIPVLVEGSLKGVIGFENCAQPHPWPESEIRLLSTTVNLLSKVLVREKALQDLTIEDVARRIDLKTRLKHIPRLDSVETIAMGMSDNFQNLLAGIMANCQLIKMKFNGLPELERYSNEIIRLTRKGSDLINNLVLFSRKAPHGVKTTVNLSEILSEVYGIMASSFGKRIEIRTDWPDELPVQADGPSMSQLILHLCTNARDAMPDGGVLSLKARREEEMVHVIVKDTGVGMDESTMERMYDPFFTTKVPGRGAGLGLSIAYGIVRQHGGDICVQTEINRGSSFEVILPRVKLTAQTSAEDKTKPTRGGAGGQPEDS